jgi:hypothetical protein
VPRRNRVDPWGDLHAVPQRGTFTGNRGCVVDDHERVVRHHGSPLWITCRTEFRGWRVALARPRRWTPLFFLDDAVALAAGHRPCATCRRADYRSYRDAVTAALGRATPIRAAELTTRLRAETQRAGRGLVRAPDRITWPAAFDTLPDGAVIVGDDGEPRLVLGPSLLRFSFDGWCDPAPRPVGGTTAVLTPPTSVAALAHGFRPTLHASAAPTGAHPPVRWSVSGHG